MKQQLLILLISSLMPCQSFFAQCSTTTCTIPVPAINAQDACILPNPQALNCYYGGTTPDLPQSFPPSWCTDIDNNHWFAFTATSSLAFFVFNVFGCTNGHSIQVGIFSTVDCIDFQTITSCTTISDVTSYTIIAPGMTIGQVYYMCIDGTDGALCQYSINGQNTAINVVGSNNVCIPSSPVAQYSTPSLSSWTVNPPGAGTIISNPINTNVMVEWLQPGVAEICAQNLACANAPVECLSVNIGGGETEQHVDLCEGKTVTCAGQVFNTPGVHEVHFNNASNCDSLVKCIIHLIPKDTTIESHSYCQGDSVQCAGKYFSSPGEFPITLQSPQGCDSLIKCQIHVIPTYNSPLNVVNLCGPAVYSLCDTTYTSSGLITRTCTGSLGCDSTLNVDLAIFQPNAVIAAPGVLGCAPNSIITLSSTGSTPNTASGGITIFKWTGPGIVGPDNQSSVQVNQAGQYCLLLTHGRDTVFCSDTTCVTVADSGAIAAIPLISGNPFPCPGTTGIYIASSSASATSYTWTVPGNLPFTQISADTISISWPDTLVSGQVCVTANNLCGSSPPACLPVMVQAPIETPILSGPISVCAGGGDYTFTLNLEQAGVIYLWTAPAGAVLSGTGDTVKVNFLNAVSGEVCVTPQSVCDTAAPLCLNVAVNEIPTAGLSSDAQICSGDSINLNFTTGGAGLFDITWSVGNQVLVLNDILNGHVETVSPAQTTTYKLLGISDHSTPACTAVLNDSVTVTVWPNDSINTAVQICEGNTYFAGGALQTVSGVYTDHFQSIHGCDSVVVTTLTVFEIDTLLLQTFSCNAAQAGIFTNSYLQANGCDSIVINTVTLLPSDTILLFDKSCDLNSTGVFTQHLLNVSGCDSTVITTVDYALSDTTMITATSCDPAAAGVFYNPLVSADGCDSLVITTVTLLPRDTTILSGLSCNPGEVGVFPVSYTNQYGCDSTVILTISLLIPDTTNISSTTCNPALAGVFIYSLQNQAGCDSIVTETISLLPGSTTTTNLTTCDSSEVGTVIEVFDNQWGCDSNIVTITTLRPFDDCNVAASLYATNITCTGNSGSLVLTANAGTAPFNYTVLLGAVNLSSGIINALNTPEIIGGLSAGNYTVNVSSANGLSTTVQGSIQQFSPPLLNATLTSDYNGYAVTCSGATDGSAMATVSGGLAPYNFIWSEGTLTAAIESVGAGTYTVTVTDANACSATAVVSLTAPLPLSFTFTVNNLNCFGEHDGAIQVEAKGGVGPYRYSIDNTIFQASNLFSNLDAGVYTLTTLDANDCQQSEIILINAAIPVHVDLGQDQTIVLGDSVVLQALVNVPADSILSVAWTPPSDTIECVGCLVQMVVPFVSTTYSVQVTALNGCSGTDMVTIIVDRRRDLYIPNVFSPNEDGENDKFQVFARPGLVKRFKSFRVFDRWGELLYSVDNFTPDEKNVGWDGRYNGNMMNPGVFVWVLDVEFADGVTQIFSGDITLFR